MLEYGKGQRRLGYLILETICWPVSLWRQSLGIGWLFESWAWRIIYRDGFDGLYSIDKALKVGKKLFVLAPLLFAGRFF